MPRRGAGPGQPELGDFKAAVRHRLHAGAFGLNGRIRLDFSLVNSMDYYNGVIFQGFLPNIPFPALSGGRYDNLPRKMGKQVGAIGFALYMGRLEPYFGNEKQYDADLMLTYGPDADLADLAAFVEALRSKGMGVRSSGRATRWKGCAAARQPLYAGYEARGGAGMINVACQGAAGGEGLRGLCLRRVRLPRDFGEKPQADL